MSQTRRLSTRTLFFLVSLATFILLFGSVILQRIVFKADQAASALFVEPAVTVVKPGGEATLQLRASFDHPAVIAAAQLALAVDPAIVEVSSVKPLETWRLVSSTNKNGQLLIVLVPDSATGKVNEVDSLTTFGEITLTAKKEASMPVSYVAEATKILAIDPTQTPSLYNALSSTQAAALTIATNAVTTPPPSEPELPKATDSTETNLATVRSIDVVVGRVAADILVGTSQPTNVSVEFGNAPNALVTTVEGSRAEVNSVRRLSGLAAGKRYYYRLRLVDSAGATQLTAVRSFMTAASTSEGITRFVAFPHVAPAETTVYLSTPTKPTLAVAKGSASLAGVTGEDGLYHAVVTSKLASQQTVAIAATAGTKTETVLVTFDPSTTDKSAAPATSLNSPLPFSATVQLLLGGLVAGLLLLGLLLFRLTRIK